MGGLAVLAAPLALWGSIRLASDIREDEDGVGTPAQALLEAYFWLMAPLCLAMFLFAVYYASNPNVHVEHLAEKCASCPICCPRAPTAH